MYHSFEMITRTDCEKVYDALALAEVVYFLKHPLEIFCEVQWDGVHWKQVVALAKQKQWKELKEYMDWMGETYLREITESVIQYASPRLYEEIWVEKGEELVKDKGEGLGLYENHD